jgi:hypothetical protein
MYTHETTIIMVKLQSFYRQLLRIIVEYSTPFFLTFGYLQ